MVGWLVGWLVGTGSVGRFVRQVKRCLHRQQGGFDDILVEKDVGGLSAVNAIINQYRSSLLAGKVAKEGSRDLVGEKARQELKEQVQLLNPFGTNREAISFHQKVRGSPYAGLKEEDMTRHLARKAPEWKAAQGRARR